MNDINNMPSVSMEVDDSLDTNAKIKVIGVGGGGSNAVNQMISDKSDLIDYWVFNTDSQALAHSPCPNKYVLGKNVTRGLGAGGNPEMGQKAAEDSYNDIQLQVKGSDLVFIAAGEGGGTGTGAAPVIAKAAKEAGALVLAIVTRPFNFEGKKRSVHALEGINKLRENVDALIVVSNDKLVFNNGGMSIKNAFAESDRVLALAVKTITDIILVHGVINLDFADVKATLTGKGISLIGIGYGEGENKALKAAEQAINSPLLEASIKGARSMILNITVGDDTTLDEAQTAVSYIKEASDPNGNVDVIFGVQYDADYHNKVKIAIIATDFAKEIDFSREAHPLVRRDAPVKEADVVINPEESKAVKEMDGRKHESALPNYLRDFLQKNENKENAGMTPTASPAMAPAEEPTPAKEPVAKPEPEPEGNETPVTPPLSTLSRDVPVTQDPVEEAPDKDEDDDDSFVIDPSKF